MKKNNINSIINARGLARKFIDADPKNKGKSLQVPNLVNMKFDEYLKNSEEIYSDISKISDGHMSRKVLEFIHSSKSDLAKTAYRHPEFKGDFSPNSFYDSCERILSGDEKIGNCLGLSSVIKYLLDSKGIESSFVNYPTHVALDVKINKKNVHLESTNPRGFGCKEMKERISRIGIEALIKSNLGSNYFEVGEFEKSIKFYSESIKLNPKNSFAYSNRAASLLGLNMFEEALADSIKAINLCKNNDFAYANRAACFVEFGEYKNAFEDIAKYASFSEAHKKIAAEYTLRLIKKFREESGDKGR